MNSNNNKLILQSTCYSTAILMIAGSVIQAFLLENGVDAALVASYMSVVQIVQVTVMLVVSLLIDRVKNVVRLCAYSQVFQLFLFLSLIALCIISGVDVTLKFIIVFATGIITNVIQAVYNIVSYKMPYHVVDMTNYAALTGKIGVVTGIVGISVSALMSYFTSVFDYNLAMLPFFIFGAVMLVSSFLLTVSYNTVTPKTHHSHHNAKRINLLKYRPFSLLIIPNILRGFCTGVLIIAMTVGHSLGITDKSSGAVLTLLLQVSTVLSCFIYTFVATKRNDGKIIIVSTLLLAGAMPAMLVGKNLTVFYVMYFLANFFISFINNSVPVAVTKFVDYEYIGQYSSWRMLLHTLGVAISNALITPMLSIFGGIGTMLLAVSCQLVSGISYYVFLKKCEYLD